MEQIGKTYYFMSHAYHHFIGRLVEITGRREGKIKQVRKIHGCDRSWTEFFRDGMKNDTQFDEMPDGSISWFAAFEWNHPIPSK